MKQMTIMIQKSINHQGILVSRTSEEIFEKTGSQPSMRGQEVSSHTATIKRQGASKILPEQASEGKILLQEHCHSLTERIFVPQSRIS